MTSSAKDVLLVDLDGALLCGNSFHLWLRYIVAGGLGTVRPSPRWRCRLAVLLYSAMRLSRLLDHAAWKHRVQKAWAAAMAGSRDPSGELEGFVAVLKARIDKGLLARIREAQGNQAVAVLTTAAAAEYAEALADDLGFDAVVATPRGGDVHWRHNIGAVKCRCTLAILEERKWHDRRRILYTDHLDDLPLMAESQQIHLVAEGSAGAARALASMPEGKNVRVYLRKHRGT